MTVDLKNCSICKEDLPLEKFNSKRSECRECSKGVKLQQRYGLSQSEYDEQLELQNGVCAICFRHPAEVGKLNVDHDHTHCGPDKACKICRRGLLCSYCNCILGLFEDDVDRILRSAEYIKSYRKENSAKL